MKEFLDGRVVLHAGDCMDVLRTLADNSVDSILTDPPYHLASIVKRFGGKNAAPAQFGKDGAYKRVSSGFMGKQWDGGNIAFQTELWAEVLRVLKPGGYIVAFSSSRTYHRMACAIEDAGFVTHPMIGWIFGSGFPKATNLSKQIGRMAGAKREIVGFNEIAFVRRGLKRAKTGKSAFDGGFNDADNGATITAPATDAAKQWDGWFYGLQATKPALEPIYMGQKPFSERTGAANVLKWGTGAVNIEATRVGQVSDNRRPKGNGKNAFPHNDDSWNSHINIGGAITARWPANICHDGSPEVLAGFPSSKSTGGDGYKESVFCGGKSTGGHGLGDSGSAARFFFQAEPDPPWLYCPKASKQDRAGSSHPTVKPQSLLRWLVRLITPPGGTTLDMFAGTGSTGEAAYREGFSAVLIEREDEYIKDIERRMGLVRSGKTSQKHATSKAKTADKPQDHGPLFEVS